MTGALALALAAAPRAQAETGPSSRIEPEAKGEPAYSLWQAPPTTVSPMTWISPRVGYMFIPRGSGILGVDVSIPTLRVAEAWHVRFDGDVFLNANLNGDKTAFSATANLLNYNANAVASRNIYFGGGIGWMFDGGTHFQAKLILGTPITNRINAELNTHFLKGTVAWTIVGRVSL